MTQAVVADAVLEVRSLLEAIAPYLDLTLIAAPFVVAGYWLGKRQDPRAWACMAISNVLLVATGVLSAFSRSPHLGLLISAWLAFSATRNYVALRRERAT